MHNFLTLSYDLYYHVNNEHVLLRGTYMQSFKKLLVFLFFYFPIFNTYTQLDPVLAGALIIQTTAAVVLEFTPNAISERHMRFVNLTIPHQTLIAGALSTAAAGAVLYKHPDACYKEIGLATILTTLTHIVHSPWSNQLNISSIAKNSATLVAPFIVHRAVTEDFIIKNIWKCIFKPLLTSPSS